MKNRALIACLLLGLCGCEHPLVRPDPLLTSQFKIGDVADWDALAKRATLQFAYAFGGIRPGGGGYVIDQERIPTPKLQGPVYVAVVGDTRFSAAFRPLMEKYLIQEGFTVAAAPTGAHVLQVEAQTFLYDPRNRLRSPVTYATFWTTAYGIGALARNVASLDTGVAIAAGGGIAADLLFAANAQTDAEVMVVATMADINQVYWHATEEFYVRPSDLFTFYLEDKKVDIRTVSVPVRGAARSIVHGGDTL